MKHLLTLIVACLLCLPVFTHAASTPNVLLLCVDDLKPALGCYGDALAISPNMDRLAARGLRFDLAYCNQAVCAPSRNNLMLGSRSTSLGIYGLDRNFRTAVPDAVTMTQHFMKHGYRAEAVGKIFHTGHGNHDDDASWSVPSHKEKVVEYLDPENSANGQLTREEAFFTNQKLGEIKSLPRGAAIEVMDVPDNGYADGRIADEGIKRLRAAKERQHPFFLALGFPGLFDAWGKQIIAGIGWELVKECVALDGGTLPDFSSVPQRHWMMFTEPTQRTPAPSRRPT